MTDPRYLFVAVYVLVDVFYVIISKPVYMRTVSAITNDKTPVFDMASGITVYVIMAIAWLFFVPTMTTALQQKHRISRTLAAGIVGALLGITIYGVFNFTNRAMFEKWSTQMIVRDLLWGISWLTIISAVYGYVTASMPLL